MLAGKVQASVLEEEQKIRELTEMYVELERIKQRQASNSAGTREKA